jgi:hypothetical protein
VAETILQLLSILAGRYVFFFGNRCNLRRLFGGLARLFGLFVGVAETGSHPDATSDKKRHPRSMNEEDVHSVSFRRSW